MTRNQILARAEVGFNGDYFDVIAVSIGMLNYHEPSAEVHYLAPDVDNEELGEILRRALAASKRTSVAEFQQILASGELQKMEEERNKHAMKKYGYKSKKAMFRKMMCCWISVLEDEIRIQPTHHKSIDGYSGISPDGDEILNLSVSVTNADLGAAVREGFKRCTSAVN